MQRVLLPASKFSRPVSGRSMKGHYFIVIKDEARMFLKYPFTSHRPGQRSRYSDLLRAGRSGDRIPVGAKFSAPVQTGPGAHPASCKMGTGSFPGVKRPRRGIDHPPHLAPRLKEGQSYTSTPPLGLRSLSYGERYLYLYLLSHAPEVSYFMRKEPFLTLASSYRGWLSGLV